MALGLNFAVFFFFKNYSIYVLVNHKPHHTSL